MRQRLLLYDSLTTEWPCVDLKFKFWFLFFAFIFGMNPCKQIWVLCRGSENLTCYELWCIIHILFHWPTLITDHIIKYTQTISLFKHQMYDVRLTLIQTTIYFRFTVTRQPFSYNSCTMCKQIYLNRSLEKNVCFDIFEVTNQKKEKRKNQNCICKRNGTKMTTNDGWTVIANEDNANIHYKKKKKRCTRCMT